MGLILGPDAKLYRNTGTYAAPTWNEIPNVKDLTLGLDKNEIDVTTRGSAGWKAVKGGLKDAPLEFGMVYDTADADFAALLAAWFAGTAVELQVLDGSATTNGTQGLRATYEIISFDNDQSLSEALGVKVVMKPARADNAPEWVTISV